MDLTVYKQTKLKYGIITILIFIFIFFAFSLQFFNNFALLLVIRNFYSYICHQMENRTFIIYNKPMFICARCFGIYLGSFFLFFLLTISNKFKGILSSIDLKIIILAILPILLDWSINFTLRVESTNLVRLLTGLTFSIVPVYFLNVLLKSL